MGVSQQPKRHILVKGKEGLPRSALMPVGYRSPETMLCWISALQFAVCVEVRIETFLAPTTTTPTMSTSNDPERSQPCQVDYWHP